MKQYKLQHRYSTLDYWDEFYFSVANNKLNTQMMWIYFYLGKLFPDNHRKEFMFYPFERTFDLGFGSGVKTVVEYTDSLPANEIAENLWKKMQRILGYNNEVVHYINYTNKKKTMCGIYSHNKIGSSDPTPADDHRMCIKCLYSRELWKSIYEVNH